jgi:hypothetical protein
LSQRDASNEEDIDSGKEDEMTEEDEPIEDDGIFIDFDDESEDLIDEFKDHETFYKRMKCMAHTLQLCHVSATSSDRHII